ncbi:MAG: hypothetical protein Q4A33_00495 [Candidatus Saccharibacteria bacterium]|nr:hypothetical protein [Candidatus Saccharibacteria bacterium]
MDPSNNEFYQQFSVNNDVILSNPAKPQDRKKRLIVIASLVVALVAIVVFVVLLSNGTFSQAKQDFGEASKEYAKYFIYGPQPDGKMSYYDMALDDYYFANKGRNDQNYFNNLKGKLENLAKIAPEDKAKLMQEQVEWIRFYEIATAYLNDYTTNWDYQNITKSNNFLESSYDSITKYVEKEKASVSFEEEFRNGRISDTEYNQYKADRNNAESDLRAWRKVAYNKLAQCAKELYAQK